MRAARYEEAYRKFEPLQLSARGYVAPKTIGSAATTNKAALMLFKVFGRREIEILLDVKMMRVPGDDRR
jgi:hypothetical protein